MAAIHVRVRLFAIQREQAGTRSVELDLPSGATVEDAWAALVERFPALAPGRPSVRFARNGAYAEAGDVLADGDEVVVIPPVSGGAGPDEPNGDAPSGDGPARATPDRRRILRIQAEPFEPDVLEQLAARLATEADGAIVAFLGRTRVSAGTPAPGQEAEAARHGGQRVLTLEYEALEPLAIGVLEAIADEIAERFGVERLAVVHRVGRVPLGEPSIAVVAVAPHRDAAFAAARYAIDEAKARAPIWKAEHFADGHVWIGEPARPGPADRRSDPSAGT